MDHDTFSNLFFGLSIAIADALRIIARAWEHHFDLGTLGRLLGEHCGLGPSRVGDVTWRLRFQSDQLKDGIPSHIVLPTEFQLVPDLRMGIRHRECAGQFLDALMRDGSLAREDRLRSMAVYVDGQCWPKARDRLAGLVAEVGAVLVQCQQRRYALP